MINPSLSLSAADALTFGKFVQATYDVYAKDKSKISPLQADYPNFPEGYTLRYNIHMNDFVFTQGSPVYYGFIAESIAQPNNLVVGIRGTEGFIEWWDDFHVAAVPCPFGANSGKVTTGFLTLYNSLMVSLPGQSDSAIKLTDTAKAPGNASFNIDNSISLTVTGHSLGASLATLYGLHLASEDKNVTIYTFASPCVGDSDFVSYYDSVITASYRIYNEPDVVPKLLLLLGYTHVLSGSEVNSMVNANIKKSIGCFHSLSTYLYLLGAPLSTLGICAA